MRTSFSNPASITALVDRKKNDVFHVFTVLTDVDMIEPTACRRTWKEQLPGWIGLQLLQLLLQLGLQLHQFIILLHTHTQARGKTQGHFVLVLLLENIFSTIRNEKMNVNSVM